MNPQRQQQLQAMLDELVSICPDLELLGQVLRLLRSKMMQEPTIQSQAETKAFGIIAEGCAEFLRNISTYERDARGRYPRRYTGWNIITPITEQQYKMLQLLFEHDTHIEQSETRGVWLTVNGKRLGDMALYHPLSDAYFLALRLVKEMALRPSVVVEFARYGKYRGRVDTKLLEVLEEEPVPFIETGKAGFHVSDHLLKVLEARKVNKAARLYARKGGKLALISKNGQAGSYDYEYVLHRPGEKDEHFTVGWQDQGDFEEKVSDFAWVSIREE